MTDITKTLAERGARYGEFIENAGIAQALKEIMREGLTWESLDCDQREALDMLAAKVSRIVTGDPRYVDNWHDIIGYAQLVEDRLTREQHVRTAIEEMTSELEKTTRESGCGPDQIIVHTFAPRDGKT